MPDLDHCDPVRTPRGLKSVAPSALQGGIRITVHHADLKSALLSARTSVEAARKALASAQSAYDRSRDGAENAALLAAHEAFRPLRTVSEIVDRLLFPVMIHHGPFLEIDNDTALALQIFWPRPEETESEVS